MGSSQGRRNNQQLNDFATRDAAISQGELEHNRALRNEEQGRVNDTYNRSLGGYENFQSGGLSSDDLNRLRGLSSASGGGGGGFDYSSMMDGGRVDLDRLRTGEKTWREMMDTGGFDEATKGRLSGDLDILRGLGKTGGIDAESMNRFRGGGHYEDFAKTGGLSNDDRNLIRDRITSSIPATYDALQRSIGTTNRVVGNAGPGSQALTARMGRDSAREIASINRDAELSLLDRIMEGRKFGVEGMTRSENALQGMRTGNMFRGAEGAFDRDFGLHDRIASNKMGGAQGFQEMERYNQDLLRSESDKAIAGMEAGAARGAAGARQRLGDEWDILDFQNRNRMFGTEGMTGLHNTSLNSSHAYSDRIAGQRRTDNENVHTNVQTRHDTNPSLMRSIGTGLDIGARTAGAVGGIMAGASGPGSFRRQGNPTGRP